MGGGAGSRVSLRGAGHDKGGFDVGTGAGFNHRVSSDQPAPVTAPDHPVTRALAPALRARLLGSGLLATGLAVVVLLVVAGVVGLPAAVVTGVVALATIGVVVLLLLLGPRHWVVRLDADGYRVRALRSARTRSARWTDVLDLRTTTLEGVRCLVVRLRDGGTTTLPVDVVEGDPEELTALFSACLDRSHGYRRLR